MKIEFSFNNLGELRNLSDWWFDLGFGYLKTKYDSEYRNLISFSFIFFNLRFRW